MTHSRCPIIVIPVIVSDVVMMAEVFSESKVLVHLISFYLYNNSMREAGLRNLRGTEMETLCLRPHGS